MASAIRFIPNKRVELSSDPTGAGPLDAHAQRYPSRPLIKIVTLYGPDPEHWVNFEIRRV